MADKSVIDAVNARLASLWTSCPVRGLNLEGDTPADGSAFLAVEYPIASSSQISIGSPGSNVYREIGAIRFVINVQRGDGLDGGSQMAKDLAALFRGKQFSGVNTWAPSSPVLDDRNDIGNYWKLTFAVPYYFDLIG